MHNHHSINAHEHRNNNIRKHSLSQRSKPSTCTNPPQAHVYPRGAHAAPIPPHHNNDQETIQLHPTSAPINLYGTYQEILTQLAVINPTWESDFVAAHKSAFITSKSTEKRDEKSDISEAATKVGFAAPKCSSPDGNISNTFVKNGIKHLNGIKGEPKRGAGPANCERVSCEVDSAIWW